MKMVRIVDWNKFIGKIYNNWEILEIYPKENNVKKCKAKCLLCGNEKIYSFYEISANKSKMCIECHQKNLHKIYEDKLSYIIKDLIGKSFGNLTIIGLGGKKIKKNGDRQNLVLCKCICGNTTEQLLNNLKKGKVTSCGCLQYNKRGYRKSHLDVIGIKQHMLTAINIGEPFKNKKGNIKGVGIICKCDCGKEVLVRKSGFLQGKYHSCGCTNKSFQELDFVKEIELLGLVGEKKRFNVECPTTLWKNKEFEVDYMCGDFGFEYNGIYFHQEGKDTYNKQMYKTKEAHHKGFNLIHIYEDQWLDPIKKEIIKDMVRYKLGNLNTIYARKCEIVEVSHKDFNLFCDYNHIQGHPQSIKTRYGLQYNGELVAVMGFNKNELVRFCSKLGYSVVGGFTKLLKHFIKNTDYDNIFSFGDMDIVDVRNNVYLKNGFIEVDRKYGDYFYSKRSDGLKRRYHKCLFRKAKIEKKFNYKFAEGETEYEAMDKLGYLRIGTAGKAKYLLKIK